MSEITLRFQIAGGDVLERQLPRFAMELTDFTEPLRESGEAIYDGVRYQFATEGRGQTPPWPALSPKYAAWKRRHYYGKTMLRLTDALMRSLTQPGSPGAVHDLTQDTLTIGTDLETPTGGWNVGLIHQLGAPRASIPPRPMLRLTMGLRTRIVTIFQRWLQRKASEADLAVS